MGDHSQLELKWRWGVGSYHRFHVRFFFIMTIMKPRYKIMKFWYIVELIILYNVISFRRLFITCLLKKPGMEPVAWSNTTSTWLLVSFIALCKQHFPLGMDQNTANFHPFSAFRTVHLISRNRKVFFLFSRSQFRLGSYFNGKPLLYPIQVWVEYVDCVWHRGLKRTAINERAFK